MDPIVYLGTPDEAVPPLRALHRAGAEIVLVVSRADARRRRGKGTSPSPVKAAASELGIPVTSDLADIAASGAELGVVVAYGRIIPGEILEAVPMINIHFSKLPRWRGAAPVERAILAGDTETAVAIMQMEEGLDTGAIHAESLVAINPTDTADSLRERLVEVGTNLLLDTLASGLTDTPRPQEGEPVYAHKIVAADRHLDFARTTADLDAIIRIGRAHTLLNNTRFLIWRATPAGPVAAEPGTLLLVDGQPVVATIDGSLQLHTVQPANKPKMPATAWWNGAQPSGLVLGHEPDAVAKPAGAEETPA